LPPLAFHILLHATVSAMDYTPTVVSKRCLFFIFKHSWAPKRSWKISHGGPWKSWKSPGFFSSERVGTLCTVAHGNHQCRGSSSNDCWVLTWRRWTCWLRATQHEFLVYRQVKRHIECAELNTSECWLADWVTKCCFWSIYLFVYFIWCAPAHTHQQSVNSIRRWCIFLVSHWNGFFVFHNFLLVTEGNLTAQFGVCGFECSWSWQLWQIFVMFDTVNRNCVTHANCEVVDKRWVVTLLRLTDDASAAAADRDGSIELVYDGRLDNRVSQSSSCSVKVLKLDWESATDCDLSSLASTVDVVIATGLIWSIKALYTQCTL